MTVESFELDVETKGQNEVFDLTHHVKDVLMDCSIRNGVCLIYCPHTSASLVINEAEEWLEDDIVQMLYDLVPAEGDYQHDQGGESNAHAHLKNVLMGSDLSIPVINGRLRLGPWQAVLLVETDGPREREVIVQVLGE